MYRKSYRKPDSLMLLTVFVLLAAMLTTAIGDDRPLPTSRFVSDLQDTGPGEVGSQRTTTTPDLYLNLRYPW